VISLLLLVLLVLLSPNLTAQSPLARVAQSFAVGEVQVDGAVYPYRLLEPLPELRDRDWPLVVYLHGAGERGEDNLSQLKWLPEWIIGEGYREQLPCYLLAVQCPVSEQWVDVAWGERQPTPMASKATRSLRAVQSAVAQVLGRSGVDRARVYATGLSMGGYGVWDLVARDPEQYAAALAVCGGGDPEAIVSMMDLPVEVWHGQADPVVPVIRSRLMVREYERLGLEARYFEPEGVGHDVWRQAYRGGKALERLFKQDQRVQHRGSFRDAAIIPMPDRVDVHGGMFQLRDGAICHAPKQLHSLAEFFHGALRLVDLPGPRVVSSGEPSAGDLSLRLDARQSASFVLDIGEYVVLTAKGVTGMRQGLACLFQLMHTHKGGVAPRGHFESAAEYPQGWLVLDPPHTLWQQADFDRLLIACWLGAVQNICLRGDRELYASKDVLREWATSASKLSIAIDGDCSEDGEISSAAIHSGDSLLKALAWVSGAETPVVVLDSDSPSRMQQAAQRLLPCALERSMRKGQSIDLPRFLSRLAAHFR
jgi:predicted esterase